MQFCTEVIYLLTNFIGFTILLAYILKKKESDTIKIILMKWGPSRTMGDKTVWKMHGCHAGIQGACD